jgi:2,3-bisphosphoglycerate-dependent phosphoglycerate mutase
MYKSSLFIAILFLVSCSTTKFYVIRHAERAPSNTMSMSSDVPLSDAGQQRAEDLKTLLSKEKINHIFSTNYIRTKSTAQPLSDLIGIPIEIYDPRDTIFPSKIKAMKGNILIVGHSNTVDDLVNGISGKRVVAGDLNDSQYGDLFIIKKKGNGFSVEKKRFGN